jgi:Kef-type K+ transport system membrane component KefB
MKRVWKRYPFHPLTRIVGYAIVAVSCCATPALAAGGESAELGLVSAIGIAVVAAAVLAVVFNRLKQPALLAYIVAGLTLAAFAAPHFGDNLHTMEQISHLGLVFLLFVIGLEMDLGSIFKLGPRAALAVLLQAPIAIAVLLLVQWLLKLADIHAPGLGLSPDAWIYYGTAGALGSTAVAVKLLGDKFDLGSQAGRVTVLTLIAEDICAVLVLSYVQSQAGSAQSGGALLMIGGGVLVILAIALLTKYVLAGVMTFLAKSPDLLSLVALAWCFLCAESISRIGLSAEMGALIAGLTLGRLPQHAEVLSKVINLRDFFMALFFVALGMSLPAPTWAVLGSACVLVIIVVIARLVLFAPTLLASGLGPIVSFTAALNISQISEFSLLLIPIGISTGALTTYDASVISYGLMISVVLTTYVIKNNYRISIAFERMLWKSKPVSAAAIRHAHAGAHATSHGLSGADIVLLGYYLNAEALAHELENIAPELIPRTLVIDFNLHNHPIIRSHGFRVMYGDISNPDTLRHVGLGDAKVVVSTISNAFLRGTSNEALLEQVKSINPNARFIATDVALAHSQHFLDRGAFACITPPHEAAPAYVKAMIDAIADYESSEAVEAPEE